MNEVIDRYKSVGVEIPKSLYMDCGCCGSSDPATSVAASW